MARAGSINEASHEEDIHMSQVENEKYVTARRSAALDYNNDSKSEIIIIDDSPACDYRCQNGIWNMKNNRVIELSDGETKIELPRKFGKGEIGEINQVQKIGNTTSSAVQSRSNLHNAVKISNTACSNENILLPKLPFGTILMKHSKCTDMNVLSKDLMTPDVIEKATKMNIEKNKPICSPEEMNGKIKMRRNPVRGTKKKFDDSFARPRLLATKRRGNNAEHTNHVPDKKQTKLSNVPYMNTRSVTKKLYNVGANHQSPTVEDEIEWREWPIHGMHERPIYHPQVGLAVECLGNNFISVDGCSYQKVAQSLGMKVAQIDRHRRTTPRARGYKKSQHRNSRQIDDSFGNCMHESLHSVLAYSAQLTMPPYKKLMKNYNSNEKTVQLACSEEYDVNREVELSRLQLTKPPVNLKCIKNHAKLQRVLKCGSKKTLILLKTADSSLQNEKICTKNASEFSASTLIPVRVESEIDSEQIILKETSSFNKLLPDELVQDTSDGVENSTMKINDGTSMMSQSSIKSCDDGDSSEENWLQDLISNTVMLYCTAIGIHQDDFVMYLDTLDAQQCINWIESGY